MKMVYGTTETITFVLTAELVTVESMSACHKILQSSRFVVYLVVPSPYLYK